MKVGSWDEHNKGLWAFTECPRLGTDDEGSICPALRRSKASFWPPVSERKDCCFMIRLPLEFRQSYVMAWVVGTVFYAWMLSYLSRKATCKSALCSVPWDHKTTQLDNKLCQSTRGCPWMSFSECGSPSLTISLHWSQMKAFFISPCYSLELCIQMGISFLFCFAFCFFSFHSYL